MITNFLETTNLLARERGIRLMALGGEYDSLHDSFLGVSCVDAVMALRVDLCFVSTSAVSGGFAYHQEQHIVSVKRAMLEAAARNVLLVDHSSSPASRCTGWRRCRRSTASSSTTARAPRRCASWTSTRSPTRSPPSDGSVTWDVVVISPPCTPDTGKRRCVLTFQHVIT